VILESGADLPNDRKRRADQDRVVRVRNGRATPPVPTPSAVDLLAELVARIGAAEQAAVEREEREIARHAEVMQKLAAIADHVHVVYLSTEEVHKDLLRIAGVTDPAADAGG
jgi:hypothetical protein